MTAKWHNDRVNWQANLIEQPEEIARILRDARTVAVVGIKDDRFQPAFFVPDYLQRQGYRIVPVNPRYERVLGERCHASLLEIAEPVDIVDVFRASHNILPHAAEALQLKPKVFWMQSGIRNAEAAEILARAGILVVQSRCIMLDHRHLVGSGR